jgi:NAD(P)-dependent dehydrogenase (short-subunit alcohol dehydrogenase family)
LTGGSSGIGLAEVLRVELATRGIAVAVVCPREVETPMVEYERTVRAPRSCADRRAVAS